jgi:uncharacterized protein (DUF2336 family)
MVGYDEFESLSRSSDSERRGLAATLAAQAYLAHSGPADEHAALYAALFGFLEDRSVKVRAALAYGLLHAAQAPRPIMLALLHDAPVIARAVVQYSPVLVDADILPLARQAGADMLEAMSHRARMSPRLARALIERAVEAVTLTIVRRKDVAIDVATSRDLAAAFADNATLRGALLARSDLPGDCRLSLVRTVVGALGGARIVKGAIPEQRLNRLMRNVTDTAVTAIGEVEAAHARPDYADALVGTDAVNTRVLLHALVHGHVLFFAQCCSVLCGVPSSKVFAILETGSRAALNALFARCGLGEGVRNVLARLIAHARTVDLADDAASRHFVVTALTEDLIAEHDGDIPEDLSEAFAYLSEQNVRLARAAARGVMSAFAAETSATMRLDHVERLALPAA